MFTEAWHGDTDQVMHDVIVDPRMTAQYDDDEIEHHDYMALHLSVAVANQKEDPNMAQAQKRNFTPRPKAKKSFEPKKVQLSMDFSDPVDSLSDEIVLVYGRPKIGKSSLVASAPGVFFLDCENRLRNLRVRKELCEDWLKIEATVKALEDDKPKEINTVCVDTADALMKMAQAHICDKFQIEYIGDLEYGKGWGLCTAAIRGVIERLARLPYGLWITAHEKKEDLTDEKNVSFTRVSPNLTGKAGAAIIDLVDIIFYMDIDFIGDEKHRVLKLGPAKSFEAGDTSGKLKMPYIVLPDDWKKDYEAIEAAFRGDESAESATTQPESAENEQAPEEPINETPSKEGPSEAPTEAPSSELPPMVTKWMGQVLSVMKEQGFKKAEGVSILNESVKLATGGKIEGWRKSLLAEIESPEMVRVNDILDEVYRMKRDKPKQPINVDTAFENVRAGAPQPDDPEFWGDEDKDDGSF